MSTFSFFSPVPTDRPHTDGGPIILHTQRIASPIGQLLLIAGPHGLLRVVFECEGHDDVLGRVAQHVGAEATIDSGGLDNAASQFDDCFAGRREQFDLAIDTALMTGFQRDVLSHVSEIPYGETRTYAEVAAQVGSPRAARAVGNACARNPLPIVIPCHRVVQRNGAVGRYLAGAAAKQFLLDLEGHRAA